MTILNAMALTCTTVLKMINRNGQKIATLRYSGQASLGMFSGADSHLKLAQRRVFLPQQAMTLTKATATSECPMRYEKKIHSF